ncbi:MAG: hypothetical protein J6U52_01130, partial [Alistipes sp.]|nr:hypothetical protein [Alistipes sp.]
RFLPEAKAILESFDEEIQTACIGSISECFEGDPPFRAHGCLSQATSVGGLLFISDMISEWEKPAKKPAKTTKATKATKAAKAEVVEEKVEEKPAKKCGAKKCAAKATEEKTVEVAEEAKPKRKCVRKKK